MLKRFGIETYKPAKTPIIKKIFVKAPFNYKTPKTLFKDYKKLKNSLMHLMTKIRFDICYAVSRLGQFSSNLIDKYYTQLKRVLRYIKGIINMGIAYKKDKNIIINM